MATTPETPETVAQQIGRVLKLARVAAGVSQIDFARQVGVTANYLSLIERGHREPSLTLLRAVARHLRIPLREYLWIAVTATD